MAEFYEDPVGMARRSFLLKSCSGLGALALADLLGVHPRGASPEPIRPQGGDRPRNPRGAALSATGETGHLRPHARRDFARGHLRLQTPAREDAWRGASAVGAQYAATFDDVGGPGFVSDCRTDCQVQTAREERCVGQRPAAIHGGDRRRFVLHQNAQYRARQS
jgi:hypothetical protein